MESAGEHLRRLRHRAELMTELSKDLSRHLTTTSSALERAGYEMTVSDAGESAVEIRELRTQGDVLSEVMVLARPVAAQLTTHAQHAADAAIATEALMLLDERVHQTGREVARAGEDVSIMRSVIESAQTRAGASASLAGSLSYTASQTTAPPPPPSSSPHLGPGIAI